jgi:hypothetical protein
MFSIKAPSTLATLLGQDTPVPGVAVSDDNSSERITVTISDQGTGTLMIEGLDVGSATIVGTAASVNAELATLGYVGYQIAPDQITLTATNGATFINANVAVASSLPPSQSVPAGTTAAWFESDTDGNLRIADLGGGDQVLGSFAVMQLGPYQVAGIGDFSSGINDTDMIARGPNGNFTIFDINNNAITGTSPLSVTYPAGTVLSQWNIAGIGDFSDNPGESDMLMRNSTTGAFEVYDISHNAITSSTAMGQVGLEWTVAGFGDFSGNPGETDMMMRNSNNGAFEVYDISHNTVTSASSIGQVGLEWVVAGFADFSNKTNETDMLMRNVNTAALEVYDISHNTITSANSAGAIGWEWTVAGFADFSGNPDLPTMVMHDRVSGANVFYDWNGNQPKYGPPTDPTAPGEQSYGIMQIGGGQSSASAANLNLLIQAMAGYSSSPGDASSTSLPAGQIPQQNTLQLALPH